MRKYYNEDDIIEMLEQPAFEMATVGKFQVSKGNKPKGRQLKVFTTSDAHPQVHVHIWDTATKGNKVNICVRLDKPEYFVHDRAKDKFSKDELSAFIKFMQSPSSQPIFSQDGVSYKLKTQWDWTIMQWNAENEDARIPIDRADDGYLIAPEMPDYSKLQ